MKLYQAFTPKPGSVVLSMDWSTRRVSASIDEASQPVAAHPHHERRSVVRMRISTSLSSDTDWDAPTVRSVDCLDI